MKKSIIIIILLTLGFGVRLNAQSPTPAAQAPTTRPAAIDPKADAILQSMCRTLSAAKRMTFQAYNVSDTLLPDGQKVQFARNSKISFRRPDGLLATVIGDQDNLTFIYDGKKVTVFNAASKAYGVTDAPPTIEATFDMLADKYGMIFPLADLLFTDLYNTLTERVRSGQYLGDGYVMDIKCHHLAFRNESVDWQIWIDQSDKPLPLKVVITYKETPGHLQHISLLSGWNLNAEIPDAGFHFIPPADAKKVDFAGGGEKSSK